MDEKKLKLRMPLAPVVEDKECRSAYDKLLAEFNELDVVKVEGDSFISESDKVLPLKEYNERISAYTARRDEYNRQFTGRIEMMEDVKKNIAEIRSRMASASDEMERIDKWFDEKWGDECPIGIPENIDLMFENPEEWKRQSEECSRRFNEWNADQQKVFEVEMRFHKCFTDLCNEQSKFEEIQKKADAAFEDAMRRTLANGVVMTDEELAEYEKTGKIPDREA